MDYTDLVDAVRPGSLILVRQTALFTSFFIAAAAGNTGCYAESLIQLNLILDAKNLTMRRITRFYPYSLAQPIPYLFRVVEHRYPCIVNGRQENNPFNKCLRGKML